MKKVVGFGDLLLSLSPDGYYRFLQAESFHASYTGAEANVCVSLSQFGIPTEFVTRLPNHDMARAAVNALRRYNVGTECIAFGGSRMGLLYLEKGASQRPSKVIYDRAHSAICEATSDCFQWDAIFENAQWLHFTGITPALSDTMPAVCEAACKEAKDRGITISCDLNYRANLWSTEKARKTMERLLPFVDVLIANEEDADKVLGIQADNTDVATGKLDKGGYVAVAEKISRTYSIPYVATTLRKSITASDNEWSAMLYHRGQAYFSKEYAIHIVNRVGGGDSFSAGLIYGRLMDFDDLQAVEFAAAASCLKHSIENDFNLVTVDEVKALANGSGSGRVQR